MCPGFVSSRRPHSGDPTRRPKPHIQLVSPTSSSCCASVGLGHISFTALLSTEERKTGAQNYSFRCLTSASIEEGPYIYRQDAQGAAQTCSHRHRVHHRLAHISSNINFRPRLHRPPGGNSPCSCSPPLAHLSTLRSELPPGYSGSLPSPCLPFSWCIVLYPTHRTSSGPCQQYHSPTEVCCR